MNFAGTLHVRQARERVWAVVVDPLEVGACVPGLDQIEVVDDQNFRAAVKAGIGPVRGKFSFEASWQERDAPNHARISARGKTPGSAVTVDSRMDLSETPDGGTDLAWSADVVVHGMIASVGARLLDGFAQKQTEQFFACLRERLENESTQPDAPNLGGPG